MPPEPLPWDRRDFRKHERSGSDPRFGGGGFGGGPLRWRDQHHYPHAPSPYYHHQHQQQQQRWFSDFRSSRPLPPGHGKQGVWHMYSDEAGHGFLPFVSRYSDRNFEDDNCRPFGSRSDGRYFRYSRENRGSGQKDWKVPSWELAALPSNPGRPTVEIINQRSMENTQTCHNSVNTDGSKSINSSSHTPLESVNLMDQSQSLTKKQRDKNDSSANGPVSLGQKPEKENCLGSIDWKPLKWTRSGSFSSRPPGLSNSSRSKSMAVDSIETVAELRLENVSPIRSPCADATDCIMSPAPAPSEETSSRKKPRLGWGEGLAKFEKKKVEGPEDGVSNNEMTDSISNSKIGQSYNANQLDNSPKVAHLSDCASPATPSSVAYSSSPGIEEKESMKLVNYDHDTNSLSCSPAVLPQIHHEGPTFNLENLELTSITNLSSLINELLKSTDPVTVETGYSQIMSMNKLLVWKVDLLKALEMTESEIDALETELKALVAEPGSFCSYPAVSSSLPGDCLLKPCDEHATPSNFTLRPISLHDVSSGDMIIENIPVALENLHEPLKDEVIDSPESATSKFVEVPLAEEGVFPSKTGKCIESLPNLDVNSSVLDKKCLESSFIDDEDSGGDVDNSELIFTNSSQSLASVNILHCDLHDIYRSIVVCNKDSAARASEELNKLFPAKLGLFDFSTAITVSSVFKQNFLKRKRFLQFKEKVITLKYKVFQHFWKQGRVVSLRKLQTKPHKKFDLSRSGHRKNRASSRSRISSSVGSSQTVPAEEVLEFVYELLSESPFKCYRDHLKMPVLILDQGIKMSRFISNNGLLEDPCAVEKERSMINPWMPEEREILIDKLSIFGKDFRKIASFLEHKTIADCIEFYYKNHKSECFEKVRKKPEFIKQRKSQSIKYLVGSGKRWNREANAASLDILGAASAIAANAANRVDMPHKSASRFFFGASSSYKTRRNDDGPLQRSNSLDAYNDERETVAADVLAGICVSLSSEAMSSCITSSVDPGDKYQDWRCQRVGSSTKRPLTPEVTQNIEDECSDESCGEMNPADWTDKEKSIFIQAMSSYGKNFVMISQCIRTKSRDQCKIFFSKARKCLGLDLIQPGAGNVSGDVNEGGSDIEDASVVETGSVICNASSGCKNKEDCLPPERQLVRGFDMAVTRNLKPAFNVCEDDDKLDSLDPMVVESVLNYSSMDNCHMDVKPVINFSADTSEKNGACVSPQELTTMVISSITGSAQGFEDTDDHGLPIGSNDAENMILAEGSDGVLGEEYSLGFESPKNILDVKKGKDRDAGLIEASGINCEASKLNDEAPLAGKAVLSQGCHKKADLAEKSCVIPSQHNGHITSGTSSILFSVPIKYQKTSNHNVLSAVVDANGMSDKHSRKAVMTGDCRQHLPGHSLSDPVESSQILSGYPISVQTMMEINGNINCKKPRPIQNVLKRDECLCSDHTKFALQKCNGSKRQSKVDEAPCPSQEETSSRSRPQSGYSSGVDKPSSTGDVKLFGKILSSSQQKPSSCDQRSDEGNSQHHKSGCQSLNVKFNGDPEINSDSTKSKLDHICVENFVFLDGNKKSPLSDSSLLLSKYPAAFSNYAVPTVKLKQPPLHEGVKRSDCSLNGVSIFHNREPSGDNGAADFQVLRNQDVQPFTMDMKQPRDLLISEMQRRNGFDGAAGTQEQARGTMGINVVRRGGIVVGGQCSDISDPVTAIKMHYTKTEQLSLQGGNIIKKEDDLFRSNGDVGR